MAFKVWRLDDIEYGDQDKQKLNIYIPLDKNDTQQNQIIDSYNHDPCSFWSKPSTIDFVNKRPVLMYVHGGGWMCGDRNEINACEVAKEMAKRGYITVVPSYRLSRLGKGIQMNTFLSLAFFCGLMVYITDSSTRWLWLLVMIIILAILAFTEFNSPRQAYKHPAHIRDVASAFAFIKTNISRVGGKCDKISIMGHSAGAHLCALLVMDHQWLSAHHLSVCDIKAVVCISGVYTVSLLKKSTLGRLVLQNVFGKESEEWPDAFPASYVDDGPYHVNNELVEKSFITPPIMLLNAEYDYSLKEHGVLFGSALKKKGYRTTQYFFKEVNHFNIIAFWFGRHHRIADKIVEFLEEN